VDLSVTWNEEDDLFVGVTRRMDDGVVEVELEDDECLTLLSRCESAKIWRLWLAFGWRR
jgi:hypothetical protein